jgi:chemosensory pili system protein ChpA (sensor histidine kinase/response regulator)
MEAEILKTFFEEAAGYLPTMRSGVIAYERDASQIAELQTARRQAHTIKGSARMLELKEIGEIAAELESELKVIIRDKSELSEDQTNDFLSKILILESHLSELSKEFNETAEISEAADSGVFQIPDSAENLSIANVIEEFDIDAEMLEVFSLEAEDHLRNISANVEILSKNVNNREALLEIRRSAHTLKGAAGIVGFKKLSALAHRVEDLLDYLSENEIESAGRVFELLLASTDCLSALAGGDNSSGLNEKVTRLYQNFDDVFAGFQSGKTADSGNSEKIAPQSENDGKAASSTAASKNQIVPAERQIMPSTKENHFAETRRANPSVIRVSVERINELFNLVGEMVISRSVFEQRLREMERQIEELHHTTRRLKISTGRLETDSQNGTLNAQSRIFPASSQSSNIFQSSLFNFDALEFDRYDDFHQTTLELIEAASDSSTINAGLDHLLENLNLLFDSQRRLIEEMQLNLLRLRIISLGSLSPRLQQTVRVTAEEEDKLVELVIENESLEVETEILDSFIEPLLHLLRNAVAHGIETPETRRQSGKSEKGKITLRAFSEGTHVVFVVSDDGKGISIPELKERAINSGFISQKEAAEMPDEEAYSLIFLPGLSTAAQINEISGRGVGMNIVNSGITRRQGTISIKSEAEKGTSFTIRLPMSLTATRAILVRAGTQNFAFPLNLVRQITEISADELEKISENKTLVRDAIPYSLIHFNDLVNLSSAQISGNSKMPLILLKSLENPCALAVDQILKTEEIVIKPLDSILKNIPEITGASILGDGSVIPVLDLIYLLKGESEKARKREREKNNLKTNKSSSPPLPHSLSPRLLKVLVVDDSPSVRQMNSRLIKNAGWQVSAARDGLEALEIIQASADLPDIILTDIEMPRMDGYELLASLKGQEGWQNIPVITITSRAGEKHRRKAFDLGADAYLIKPYEDAELLEKIRVLTGNAEKKD